MQLLMTYAHKSWLDVHKPVQVKNLKPPYYDQQEKTFPPTSQVTCQHLAHHIKKNVVK